ncbi:MAG: hypothetical protein AAB804_02970 [Patescibacteria group bacterium]
MKYLALVILIGVTAVGMFGFAGMSHDMDHGGGGCIASIVSGSVVCPENMFASALYHITAYRDLSQATMAASFLSVVSLLLFLVVLAMAGKPYPIPIAPSLRFLPRTRDELSLPRWGRFLRRLSLFQNSPPFAHGV